MNETQSLLEQHKFIRGRLVKLLKEISESGHPEALTWMVKGRAHIAWQMMHCAATIEKYLHVRLENAEPEDMQLVEAFGGGSTPDPGLKITADEIIAKLDKTIVPYYDFFNHLDPARLKEFPPGSPDKTYREIIYMLNWHEASHEGQCRIIWNSFKAENKLS